MLDEQLIRKSKEEDLNRVFRDAEDLPPLYNGNEHNIVRGNGDVLSRVMLIGEAPGSDEDREGEPFIGRAGKLLNSALENAGIPRESVYVTNIVKARPPNNRKPTPSEIIAHWQVIVDEFAIIDPVGVLLLGGTALETFSPGRRIGDSLDIRVNSKGPWMMATYHPSYVLHGGMPRHVWYDQVNGFFSRLENYMKRNTT